MCEMPDEEVSLSHCIPLSLSLPISLLSVWQMLTSFCILQPQWYNDRTRWSQGLGTDAITELHLGNSPVCLPYCSELVSD